MQHILSAAPFPFFEALFGDEIAVGKSVPLFSIEKKPAMGSITPFIVHRVATQQKKRDGFTVYFPTAGSPPNNCSVKWETNFGKYSSSRTLIPSCARYVPINPILVYMLTRVHVSN